MPRFVDVLALSLSLVTPALAAQPASAMREGRRHFERGLSLHDQGDNTAALAEFELAWRLTPRPSVLFNIAVAQHALHRDEDALSSFRRFLELAPSDATEMRVQAQSAIAQIEATRPPPPPATRPEAVSRRVALELLGLPASSAVLVDGVAQPNPTSFQVVPGSRLLRVEATGHVPWEGPFTVERRTRLQVSLAPLRTPSRRNAWIATGVTAGLAVTASILGFVAIDTYETLLTRTQMSPDVRDLQSRGEALSVGADVVGVLALAAGITSLVLWLRPDAPQGRSSVVALARSE